MKIHALNLLIVDYIVLKGFLPQFRSNYQSYDKILTITVSTSSSWMWSTFQLSHIMSLCLIFIWFWLSSTKFLFWIRFRRSFITSTCKFDANIIAIWKSCLFHIFDKGYFIWFCFGRIVLLIERFRLCWIKLISAIGGRSDGVCMICYTYQKDK